MIAGSVDAEAVDVTALGESIDVMLEDETKGATGLRGGAFEVAAAGGVS